MFAVFKNSIEIVSTVKDFDQVVNLQKPDNTILGHASFYSRGTIRENDKAGLIVICSDEQTGVLKIEANSAVINGQKREMDMVSFRALNW